MPQLQVFEHTSSARLMLDESILKANSLKVGLGLVLSTSSHTDVVNNNGLASAASNLNVNRFLTKSGRVLKEVVVLTFSLGPGLAAINRDLNALDRLVGVDNLDGEPVGRSTRLVVKHKRSGDATLDKLVRGLDYTVCAADGLECVREEIEMAGIALGTLVDNLDKLVTVFGKIARIMLTMALMVPEGPVTSMQAPQLAASSHF